MRNEQKRQTLQDIGCTADDWLEGAKRDQHALLGATRALQQLANSLVAVMKRIDQDLDDDKIPEKPMEVAAYAKLQVQRCIDAAQTLAIHEDRQSLAAQGAIAAFTQTVAHVSKLVKAEDAKEESISAALASGDLIIEDDEPVTAPHVAPRDRPVGIRPGSSVAQQRKRAARGEKRG